MSVFTVLQPAFEASDTTAADRTVFLSDGFCWPAFVFGPFWLACRRAWLALGAWILVNVALGLATAYGWIHAEASPLVSVGIALLLGIEGNSIREGVLLKRRFRIIDLVSGHDREEAEHIFFRRSDNLKTTTPAPSSVGYSQNSPPILGLFPSAENSR